ncbi:MAG: bifunctional oligoribonuclease/PAP phosphatase NrnA [Clostridia bacterium]|nr:bifunctional oligoribonuclease/PAP phosphatase NrnA [Clostridia bacterium]
MNTSNKDIESVIRFISEGERFTLLSHISPDGDTLGSALALRLLLKRLGKTVEAVCANPVPKIYSFMPGADEVILPEDAKGYERVISVDCADTPRFGRAISLFSQAERTAAIDHHITNPHYAETNLVVADASATAEIMHALYLRMGVEIDRDAATCLYTGLVTDTGNLSYSNTTANTLRIIADFVEKKLVDVSELNRLIYRNVPYAKTRVQGFVVSNIQLECDGMFAYATLTQAQMKSYGATNEDCEGIIDCVRDIDSVRIAAFVRESADGSYKVSLRSKGVGDVGRIAALHGGGGHEKAAGYTAHEPLSTVIASISAQAKEELARVLEHREN